MIKTRTYNEWKQYLKEMSDLDRGHDCSDYYSKAKEEFKK